MSTELDATNRLVEVAAVQAAALRAAVQSYATAHNATVQHHDLLQMVPDYAALILQAEAVKAAADAARTAMRTVLATVLDDTGAPAIGGKHHTVSIASAPAAVIITDASSIPAAFIRTTEAPDKEAIRKAIEAGQDVPGAVLSRGNGAPVLSIRKRNQK